MVWAEVKILKECVKGGEVILGQDRFWERVEKGANGKMEDG